MGYFTPVSNVELFELDDTNLIVSSDSATSTSLTDYTDAKKITLKLRVVPSSKFTVKFDLKNGLAGGSGVTKARLYHNNTLLSTKTQTSDAYVTQTVEVNTVNFFPNDVLTLQIKKDAGGDAYTRYFRVYAIRTPFAITQESV